MSQISYQLVIGSKAWSSWSLRPWLLMRQFDIPFDEKLIALRTPQTAEDIAAYSPSGKIPALMTPDGLVWDSLAIAEYLADSHPDIAIWPRDRGMRALARSISAEMHSGFQPLRANCPMDFNARGLVPADPAAIAGDVARIDRIWNVCLQRPDRDGPFLFGRFCAADAMFAPVVSRVVTYELAVSGAAHEYVAAVMALPTMAEWSQGCTAAPEVPRG